MNFKISAALAASDCRRTLEGLKLDMVILLNSSKTLDFDRPAHISKYTRAEFTAECEYLVRQLRKYSLAKFAKLMDCSEKLARLNIDRYRNWQFSPDPKTARQALLAFTGDIYSEMTVNRYKLTDFNFAQKHLRILSGLYGILRPLDLIQPYRLEMKTKLATARGADLYRFWGLRIHRSLQEMLKIEKSGMLINLVSLEYFKAVKAGQLDARVITPSFKERRGDSYRVVALYAKKARGAMCDFIIRNRLTRPEDLQTFSLGGYKFNQKLSSETEWIFARSGR